MELSNFKNVLNNIITVFNKDNKKFYIVQLFRINFNHDKLIKYIKNIVCLLLHTFRTHNLGLFVTIKLKTKNKTITKKT